MSEDKAEEPEKPEEIEAPLSAKEELTELSKAVVVAVVLALMIRSLLFEPFNIPSGSMKPTLLVGDYLFVSKPAYGYSRYSFPFGAAPIEGRVMDEDKPQRGDVIVFKLPSNTSVDYIKRVVGLPGDTIQVRRGRLYINGDMVEREFVKLVQDDTPYGGQRLNHYIETLPGGTVHDIYEVGDDRALDDTKLYVVPEGHYFAMGDNRDNSQDSRVLDSVGYIPAENIVGRADFIFFSANGEVGLFEIWKWPWGMRYDRFFKDIDPVNLMDEAA